MAIDRPRSYDEPRERYGDGWPGGPVEDDQIADPRVDEAFVDTQEALRVASPPSSHTSTRTPAGATHHRYQPAPRHERDR